MSQCEGSVNNEFLTRFYSIVFSCYFDVSVVSECGDVMVLSVSDSDCTTPSKVSAEASVVGSAISCKFSGCIGVRDRFNFRSEIVSAVKAESVIEFLSL